jgi:alkylhydroperoxidase family enzyme
VASDERYARKQEAMIHAILDGKGETDPAMRRGAAAGKDLPAELVGYIGKVRRHAYKVTDEDVAALKAKGYTEDQLFELTVSAALGASLERLEAGLQALEGLSAPEKA